MIFLAARPTSETGSRTSRVEGATSRSISSVGQDVASGLVAPPVQTGKRHVAPHGEGQTAPQRPVALRVHHFAQPLERGAKDARARAAGGRLQSCAEHFHGADDGCGGDAGDGAGDQGRVRVVQMGVYGASGAGSEPVVAGEVDYVGGDGHQEGGTQAAP